MERTKERRGWKEAILSFFFPPQCAACRECGWSPLCPACREALEEAFSPGKYLAHGGNGFADEMLALFPYGDPTVKALIFGWKEHDYPDYARIFGEYVARAAEKKLFSAAPEVVTFVPRRRRDRKRAGFDHAEALARAVAEQLGLPCEPLLERRGVSLKQHRLSRERRLKNVTGVFHAAKPLRGGNVLLVDDVVTTGASARECARVLKKAGAQKVFVLSLAHPEG